MRRAAGIVVALAMAISAIPAFATNGDNIIGVGTVTRVTGGVGGTPRGTRINEGHTFYPGVSGSIPASAIFSGTRENHRVFPSPGLQPFRGRR